VTQWWSLCFPRKTLDKEDMKKLIFTLILSLVFAATANASDLCKTFEKNAEIGGYFFSHDRYLLAVTQLSPFVLTDECAQSSSFSIAEMRYILSLYKVGEGELAREKLVNSRLERKNLLLSLLWNDPVTLDSDTAKRLHIWTIRKEEAQALNEAQSINLAPEEMRSLSSLSEDAQKKTVSPGFAAISSAIIPGAGQAYVGAYQSAVLSFLLNGILAGTTVALAQKDLPVPAVLSGMLFSFTYVGGIIGAHEAGEIRNRAAQSPFESQLFGDLFPALPEYRHFPQ
jgi:hypothetical protein